MPSRIELVSSFRESLVTALFLVLLVNEIMGVLGDSAPDAENFEHNQLNNATAKNDEDPLVDEFENWLRVNPPSRILVPIVLVDPNLQNSNQSDYALGSVYAFRCSSKSSSGLSCPTGCHQWTEAGWHKIDCYSWRDSSGTSAIHWDWTRLSHISYILMFIVLYLR